MTQKAVMPLPVRLLAWLPIIIGLAVLYVPSALPNYVSSLKIFGGLNAHH